MKSELAKFYDLVDDIKIAMLTTRRPDGHLVSRPMATQRRAAGADLWFVTSDESFKTAEIEADPHVNLSFFKDRTMEWISVSGMATISRDRAKIHELYAPDWKAWFPKGDDPRHGTPEDPRFVLIGVEIQGAVFMEVHKPMPIVLFEVAKGWLTGSTPEVGEMHSLGDVGR